jgi:hypothetical protein
MQCSRPLIRRGNPLLTVCLDPFSSISLFHTDSLYKFSVFTCVLYSLVLRLSQCLNFRHCSPLLRWSRLHNLVPAVSYLLLSGRFIILASTESRGIRLHIPTVWTQTFLSFTSSFQFSAVEYLQMGHDPRRFIVHNYSAGPRFTGNDLWKQRTVLSP